MGKKMLKEYSPKMKEGPETFKQMFRVMRKIVELDDAKLQEQEKKTHFLFRDHEYDRFETTTGAPTKFAGLNKMTAAGGFYPPQLVIFMKGPKQFGTGLLVSLAVDY